MRHIVKVIKIDGIIYTECYIDVNRIKAVSHPKGSFFTVFFTDSTNWTIDAESFDNLISIWAPCYKQLSKNTNDSEGIN